MGYLSRERVCGSRMRGPPFFQVTLVFTAVFIAGDLVVRAYSTNAKGLPSYLCRNPFFRLFALDEE